MLTHMNESPRLAHMVRTIADWLAQPDGTPDYYLPAFSREEADLIANELSYRLNVAPMVIGPKATMHSDYAVIVDRKKEQHE